MVVVDAGAGAKDEDVVATVVGSGMDPMDTDWQMAPVAGAGAGAADDAGAVVVADSLIALERAQKQTNVCET